MAVCHGQGAPAGDPFLGGCCYALGGICPNRWWVDYSTSTDFDPAEPDRTDYDVATATVYDSDRVAIGTVDDVARSFVGNNPNRRQRIFDQVQGTRYVCRVAALVIEAEWSGGPPDRATFDAAWLAHPDYQPVADWWESLTQPNPEQPVKGQPPPPPTVSLNRPRNWCQLYGPDFGQCCFEEDQATNDARRAVLSVDAVTVRSAATGAS